VLWIQIRIGNADPDPGGQKLPTKKKKDKFLVFKGCMFFFEGLWLLPLPGHPLYWRLVKNKLKIFFKNFWFSSAVKFYNFWSSTIIRIRNWIQILYLKCWIWIRTETNTDPPQHCKNYKKTDYSIIKKLSYLPRYLDMI
jgi:hypothetical protein